jgi:hypothetical protein
MISLSRSVVINSCAALLIAGATLPSEAANQLAQRGASPYDGVWSIVIQTTRGDCPAAIRAGVHISGGHVLANDISYSVEGHVAPNGALRVNVSAGGQGAGGFGHLSRNTGQGSWRTRSGECSGRWTAERREQTNFQMPGAAR